ncbi:AbiJ-NTD4 domain-containing protein [Aeromonas veronii]|uniref:AbiJ-NTD4 domain-containing protein n=1 Tax=Aeromonas veronii TaxID=654 RepID=UPI00366C45C5
MLFSRRKGLTVIRDTIQKDSMDDALRYGLWNAMHLHIWEKLQYNHYNRTLNNANLYGLFQLYWHDYFKYPLDNLPGYFTDAHGEIRKYFFECEWYEVYDFIEFTAQNCPGNFSKNFIIFCNHILEKELSGYRFVGEQLTDITNAEELESVDLAINTTTKYTGANKHLQTAVEYLSDRKSPDFRNSVKESISAVESICMAVSGDPKATLGAALNTIENKHNLHPAFKRALSSLYGYTSDSDGIRHALLEESTISYSDAKFMLVACSAFVNYVLGKLGETN